MTVSEFSVSPRREITFTKPYTTGIFHQINESDIVLEHEISRFERNVTKVESPKTPLACLGSQTLNQRAVESSDRILQ